MKTNFLLNLMGRQESPKGKQHSRFDSVSIASRYRVLAILLLFFTIGIGNAWGVNYNQMTPGTDALSNGDEVLIAIQDRKAGKFYFVQCGSTKHLEQTVTAGVVSNPEAATIWIATESSGKWIFRKKGAASNGYLYNSGSNTTLATDNSTSTTWYVSNGSSGSPAYKYFKIQQGSNSGRYISWSGSTFAAYANSNWSSNGVQGASSNLVQYNGALQIFKKATATAHTVRFYTSSSTYEDKTEASAEAGVTPPTMSTPCNGWAFQGWSATESNDDENTDVLSTVTLTAGKYYPSSDITLYPVYTKTTDGGSTTKSYGWETTDHADWTIDSQPSRANSNPHTGSYAGYINTNHTYVTFIDKVKVTSFSFWLKRTSNNSNYNVYIETSTDGSSWTAAATYAMSEFTNGSYTQKTKTWDGSTAYYVRFHCYNTTAVRYIDDISITYSTSTTYYYSYPTCCSHLGTIDGSITLTPDGTSLTASAWSTVANASSYTVRLYHYNSGTTTWDAVSGSSSGGASGANGERTGILEGSKSVTWSGLTEGDDYKVSVTAVGDGSTYCTDNEETFMSSVNGTPATSYTLPSSCAVPTSLTNGATTHATTGANGSQVISWSGTATNFEMYYSSSSTTPAPGQNPDRTTSSKTATISGLTPGTYYWWVRSKCDESHKSGWEAGSSFTINGIKTGGTIPVNFGQVYQGESVADKTITVTGAGLSNTIAPSFPAGSPFSCSTATLPLPANSSNATLTISASTATIGDYTHTLTLTSGGYTASVTVKINVIAKPSCTFVDNLHNLTVDKNGVSLSNYDLTAAAGTSVVFPTLANQVKGASTCEDQHYRFVGWTTSDNNTDPEDHLVTSHTLANGEDITYYAVWADGVAGVTYTKLTSNSFKTSPTKYVIGAEYSSSTYYFYSCAVTDANNSWGVCSTDPSTDAPIQFTLSGSASALVATSTEGTARYLNPASGKQFFGMSATSKTVVLGASGTIESSAASYNLLRYNYNSGSGGLRWYSSETGEPAYFYEVVAGSTPSYRTSCCANKVEAPTVTATKTSTSITLTWGDETGATGWEVSWNGGAFGSPSGTRTHTVSGLTPNTTYTWQVRATYDPLVKCGADIASGSTTTNQVYHVTYAKGDEGANCNASNSTTDATGYEAGATVTLQANGFTLVGHVFAGWTEDDDDITISSNRFTMPDHDVVITASWTPKVDKYFDRMHDQTDDLHGGVVETEGTNEGKYYIAKTGCNYSIPTAVDRTTGDACQTSHYKLQGWIAASYVASDGTITPENLAAHLFPPTGTKTATGATYYAVWAEVTE